MSTNGADVVLLNGNVLSMAGTGPASAVAFKDGLVTAVGDSRAIRELAGTDTLQVELDGRTVVPGFTDAHAHIWKIGHLLTGMLDLRRTSSLPDICSAVRGRDRDLPEGRWLLGRGFNEIAMPEKRRPTRHDLDAAVSHRPVVLTRTCGHIYSVNTAALRAAGITAETQAPAGGVIERDADGAPNGILHETAMGLINRVLPPPTVCEYKDMVSAALRHQLSLGITASSDCGVSPELLEVYLDMDQRNELPARVLVMPLRRVDGRAEPVPLPKKYVSERLRVDTVKFLADGGLSGATAAVSAPYRHKHSFGTLRFERDELLRLCWEAHNAGWRIATHAIGDVAIDLILEVYERLGPGKLRHRIEHFGLPSPEQLRRAAQLSVMAATQSIFVRELGANFIAMVPDKLFHRTYPIREMLEAHVTVALSSDAPVVEDDSPLAGMTAAVTRRTVDGAFVLPEQGITAYQALCGYTIAGAIIAGEECYRGTLTAGKWADAVVLSGDPLTTPADLLKDLRVDMTFLAGQRVYER